MKPWLLRLCLLAVSALVAMLMIEVALRALGFYGIRQGEVGDIYEVDDEILDFRYRPHAFRIRDGIPYRINNHGWRDFDHEYEKPEGVFRIVALGDSVLNGYGVHMEEVFAKELERKLNDDATNTTYEVVMLAIGALNTVQEAHLLETEGLRYDPDLILLSYVLNDPLGGTSYRAILHRPDSFGERLRQQLKRSSLVYYSYRAVESLGWKTGIRIGGSDRGDEYIERDFYTAMHSDPEKWLGVVRAFDRIEAVATDNDIPVVMVIFPVLHRLDDYPWQHIHQQLEKAAADNGFHVLDLREVYRGEEEKAIRLGWGDYTHPNTYGHRLAGHGLHDYLLRQRLVPVGQAVDD